MYGKGRRLGIVRDKKVLNKQVHSNVQYKEVSNFWAHSLSLWRVTLNYQFAAKEGFQVSYFGNQTTHGYAFCTGLFHERLLQEFQVTTIFGKSRDQDRKEKQKLGKGLFI